MSITRWDVLNELIRINKWKYGAEIGVDRGLLSIELLKANKNLNLILVEPWIKLLENEKYRKYYENLGWTYERLAAAKEEVLRKLESYEDRYRLIEHKSFTASKFVANGSLDFVFIDADHRFREVRRDIKSWYEKVKIGGALCGHDFHFTGVRNAVLQHFNTTQIIRFHDHVWLVWKYPTSGSIEGLS